MLHNHTNVNKTVLKHLGLPSSPQFKGEPTSYYGILTSPRIQQAIQKQFQRSGKTEKVDFQQTLLIKNVIYLVLDLFRDLIERIPDEKIGIVGKRAKFWPPAV
jgi:hypothetical protein